MKQALDHRLYETEFFVEATSCEMHDLWGAHSTESIWRKTEKWDGPRCEWVQDTRGIVMQIGTLDCRPVNVTFFWWRINGHQVAFWDCCSQVVDHAMVDKWFKENNLQPRYDNGHRIAFADAMNFHHCLHFVMESDAPAPLKADDEMLIAADLCDDRGWYSAATVLRAAAKRKDEESQ